MRENGPSSAFVQLTLDGSVSRHWRGIQPSAERTFIHGIRWKNFPRIESKYVQYLPCLFFPCSLNVWRCKMSGNNEWLCCFVSVAGLGMHQSELTNARGFITAAGGRARNLQLFTERRWPDGRLGTELVHCGRPACSEQ